MSYNNKIIEMKKIKTHAGDVLIKKKLGTVPVHAHKQSLEFMQVKNKSKGTGNNFMSTNKIPLSSKKSFREINSKPSLELQRQTSKLSYTSKDKDKIKTARSSSILLTNKLTKTNYAFRDSSMVPRTFLKPSQTQYSSLSKIKGADSLFIQRFKPLQEDLNQSIGGHNITQAHIPKIQFKRSKAKTEREELSDYQNYSKNMKFKLLFRERPQFKRLTKSERKSNRIDEKINRMNSHKRYLSSLLPPPPVEPIDNRPKPRGTIVGPENIEKLALLLIKNIQLFFNMYIHPKKVGDMMRAVDGYNKDIHKVLFINQFMAKRIRQPKQIYDYFWVFKQKQQRPEFYGEEDLNFFNVLQNYAMKMDKSFDDLVVSYANYEQKGVQFRYNQLQKAYSSYKDKKTTQPKIHEINDFLQRKKIWNQERREDSLSKLESLGVRFSVQERSRELIIRQRQNILKKMGKK